MAVPGSADVLRILLVSTNEDIQKQIATALSGRAQGYRLFWLSQPDLTVLRAEGLQPRVILLDHDPAGFDPISLISRLKVAAPDALIITLVGQGEIGAAGESVLAGASAFVTKPVTAAELLPTLSQALSDAKSAERVAQSTSPGGILIVFCAADSGVGCTTMAVNLALSLARAEAGSVVLADANFADPAVKIALGLQSERTAADLLTRTGRLDARLIGGAVTAHSSGVSVLLAPRPQSGQKSFSRSQTQHLAHGLKQQFDWALVDVGVPLDEMGKSWMDAADVVVVPVLPEVASLRASRLLLDQLYARGYAFAKVPVVLNRAGMPDAMNPAEVQYWLGVRVDRDIPDDQDLAALTVSHGVPAAIDGSYPEVMRAYDEWARELLGRRAARPAAAATAGFAAAAPAPAVQQGSNVPAVPAAMRPSADDGRRHRRQTGRWGGALLYVGMAVLLALLAAGVVLYLTLGRDQGYLAWGRGALTTVTPAPATGAPGLTPSPLPGAQALAPAPTSAAPDGGDVTSVAEPVALEASATAEAPSASPTQPSPTPVPSLTASATPEPSPTASATVAPTSSPTATAPAPTLQPTATRPAAPRSTATPRPAVAPAVSAPSLLSPARGEVRSGNVTFTWQPTGALPAGAAYEVVWWNAGEDPAAARGIAAPTLETTLTANLDVLYDAGQFSTNALNWAVLIVNNAPYQRLTSPAGATESFPLVYAPSGGGGGGGGGEPPPPPPRP